MVLKTYTPSVGVSVLFSEPKIPQFPRREHQNRRTRVVSVLFSEPKIPQLKVLVALAEATYMFQCSSASRKFLNSTSTATLSTICAVSVLFSEPKIPQLERLRKTLRKMRSFSALQRAENSSIAARRSDGRAGRGGFSALQRAENSSITWHALGFGALQRVSVLFSEAKIPQFANGGDVHDLNPSFSALQRAENSSI